MAALVIVLVATATALASSQKRTADKYGENYNAKPALLMKAFGTTKGIPKPLLAAVTRAGEPISRERLSLAIKCWKEKTCDTGTGGDVTVALADGFGDNVWREVTHMEFVLQALTYPEIGKIIYTNGQANTQKQISDLKSLIAQGVDVIVGFPDAGPAVLPTYRDATKKGILVAPYISGPGGTPGKDYLTLVAEDLCQLGKNFAGVLNKDVKTGKVAFLGGTPGNGLSKGWQTCEEPALGSGLELVGKADTNWTREGTLKATSALISKHPDLKGISYEYADGFMGGIRAYQAAKKPLDLVLTLRTDEVGFFCEMKKINNPNFKVYYQGGGGFDSRFSLTASMMARKGAKIEPNLIVPASMHKATPAACNTAIPAQGPVSTLVPIKVLQSMYK